MSRVDDALKRAGVPAIGPSHPEAFVSPWSTLDAPEPKPIELPRIPLREPGEAEPPIAGVPRIGPREVPRPEPAARPQGPAPHALERLREELGEALTVGPHADRLLAHEFRVLGSSLLQAQRAQSITVVMITSAASGEGKTISAINLALVLSESFGRRVLLIEADLRRPALGSLAEPGVAEGLADLLRAPEPAKPPVVTISDRLAVLPAGRAGEDPLTELSSARMQQLLKASADEYDWVIIDSPPVLAAPDASVLLPLVDAALLVVRAGKTDAASTLQAIEMLGRDRLLGVILNGVDSSLEPPRDMRYIER
jgi:capsular exopolysaccharide synthesis family protein